MVEVEQIKPIVKEQIDVINAIPKRNIGVARDKLWEISQVPVMSAFFDFDFVVIHMVSLEVVHLSGYMHGCPGL
jgi:hypothetical protein